MLKGLDNDIVQSLKTDSVDTDVWQHLFSIYAETLEDELQSDPIIGKYTIEGNEIIFLPDSSFKAGATYSAVFYYPKYYSSNDILSNKSLPGRVNSLSQEFKF